MAADHTITWDHADCEHDNAENEPWCWPDGTITCQAPPDAPCRTGCHECDDGWRDYPEHPREGRHCCNGHPLIVGGDCNAVMFLEADGYLTEDYQGDTAYPPDWVDGPVEVHWTGEGYLWSYPVAVPGD